MNAVRAQGVEALLVFSRVAEGADAEATMAKLMGSTVSMTGVHALSYALGHVGVEPDILLAPGYAAGRVGDAKNPLADALQQLSKQK